VNGAEILDVGPGEPGGGANGEDRDILVVMPRRGGTARVRQIAEAMTEGKSGVGLRVEPPRRERALDGLRTAKSATPSNPRINPK
jgi:hypothetical protein